MIGRVTLTTLLAVVLAMSGADAQTPDCIPTRVPQAATTPGGDAVVAVPARLYLDTSQSMSGFVVKQGVPSLFTELVETLPVVAGQVGSGTSYYFFGDSISEGSETSFVAASRPPAGGKKSVLNKKNGNIAVVLDHIMENMSSDYFSIIVTDLFLSGTDIPAGSASPITTALARLLDQGRSVGLVGLASWFKGDIYDLTTVKRYPHDGDLPVYAIVIGRPAQVRRVLQALENVLLRRFDRKLYHIAHYTRDIKIRPITNTNVDASAFALPNGVRQSRPILRVQGDIPQFTRTDMSSGPIGLELPTSGQDPNAALQIAAAEDRESLFAYFDGGAQCAENWSPWETGGTLASATLTASTLKFALFDGPPERFLPPRGMPFYLDVEVVGRGLAPAKEVVAWISDWGFDVRDEAAVLARSWGRGLFPTLNLPRLHAMMTATLMSKPIEMPIAHIAVAFRQD